MIERRFKPGARVRIGKCEGTVQDPSAPPPRTRVILDGAWVTDFENRFIHPLDESADDVVYAIDAGTLADIMRVLEFVSAGRRHVGVAPYPDATARRLLGTLLDVVPNEHD